MAQFFDEQGDVATTVDLRNAEIARNWAVESASRRPWRPQFREAFVNVLRVQSSSPLRILELGAGPGLLAKRVLDDLPVSEYVLFDFSKPMLEMAREALGSRAGVSYLCGDFKQVGWATKVPGTFDAILSMQAVHEFAHQYYLLSARKPR